MTEPPAADAPRPKELYIDEQWDRFIDLTVRRTVYGTLAGGVAALLLARGPAARSAAVAFGAGWGAGSAFTDGQRLVLDVGALQPDYRQLKEVAVCLLPTAVLDATVAIGVYVMVGGGWAYRGAMFNERPSEVIPLQWPAPDSSIAPDKATQPGQVQLGFSLEPISELSAKETSRVLYGEDFAKAIALNLFQFLQSFSSGSSQDSLAMPANLIDRWFTRFQEKFRKDPEFFMRHAAAP